MRDQFELNCKTVGIVLLCVGAYYSLAAVPLFFQREPDVTRMIPRSMLRGFTQSQIAEFQAATSYNWKYALKTLLLSGIAPMLAGLYLMRSNNLFVRLCYPAGHDTSASRPSIGKPVAESDAAQKTPGNADEKKLESKYAPPGYFE